MLRRLEKISIISLLLPTQNHWGNIWKTSTNWIGTDPTTTGNATVAQSNHPGATTAGNAAKIASLFLTSEDVVADIWRCRFSFSLHRFLTHHLFSLFFAKKSCFSIIFIICFWLINSLVFVISFLSSLLFVEKVPILFLQKRFCNFYRPIRCCRI